MTGGFFDANGEQIGAADFVIVGSGAGGGAAARALSGAGRSVAVLEEGPRVTAADVSTSVHRSMRQLFREGGRTAMLGRAPIPYLQGRVVGGTTFVNSAITWRTPEKVVAQWRTDFGLDELLADLDAAYATLEEEMHVRPTGDDIASVNDRMMRDGATRVGIESRPTHRNELGCKGSGRCIHGCPNAAKQSTAINHLVRAAEGGARIFANAHVRRVVLRGGRAVGVEGRAVGSGRPFYVEARKAVVLAASAVQSPNLLARSGVRNAHLGRHFMAHPGTSIVGVYPQRIDMWTGASQGYEAFGLRDKLGVKLETINIPPEVSAARLPGAGPRLAAWMERLPHVGAWAIALKAEAEGTVRPSWLFGDAVRFTLTTGDVDRLRRGIRAAAEMHFAAGAREVLASIHGMPEVLTSPDELRLFDDAPLDARAYNMIATHLFGGCRAARDPAAGVVDPSLAVHGLRGLYVMDASVLPTNTGVNPQHGIMAVALSAARRLAERGPA